MSLRDLTWLGDDPRAPFPDPALALREPDGLLAAGGDLTPVRLLNAYRSGIFPWFSDGQVPLWWSPDPRAVFATGRVAGSRRFRRSLRACPWVVRADTAFGDVVRTCARIPRAGQRGTWITREMIGAYEALHALGHAHSFEVFDRDELVGGIYGVAIGEAFFGESMFSRCSGGSKVALAALAHVLDTWGWPLIDAQVENDHLIALGAERWPRERFLVEIAGLVDRPGRPGPWSDAVGELPAAALAAPRG